MEQASASAVILSANGRAFSDHTAAAEKAKVLTDELGEPYVVVDYPLGGYAVIRQKGANPEGNNPARPGNSSKPMLPPMEAVDRSVGAEEPPAQTAPHASPDAGVVTEIVLRPSWRSFWKHHLTSISGAFLYAAPYATLHVIFVGLFHIQEDTLDQYVTGGLLRLLSAIGILMLLSAVSHMLALRASRRYTVGRHRVETQVGIFSLQTQRVEYRYIRSVNVRQSPIDRILNIGTVEFSSAAREGGDVLFRDIYCPRGVEQDVSRRMELASRADE